MLKNRKNTGKDTHPWVRILTFLVVTLSFFLPRAFGLDRFVTTDEGLWIIRSANFYNALAQRDFANTFQSEHPGVTVMWAGTLGFLWRFPELRGLGLVNGVDVFQYEEILSKVDDLSPKEIMATSRLIMVVANTLLVGLSFLYAKKWVGYFPAIFGFLVLAFDPFFIAHTRLLHLDGLLSSLMLLSMLSYMTFLKDARFTNLLISAIAAGLSWLTKSPGLFLIPGILLITLFEIALGYINPTGGKYRLSEYLQKVIKPRTSQIFIWACLGVFTFFALWPAMWSDPVHILEIVFGGAFAHASMGHDASVFFYGNLYNSGKIGLSFFYPVMILWRSTPVTLIGLFAGLIAVFFMPRSFFQQKIFFSAFLLVALSIAFVVFMTLGAQKFDRYILPIFPMLDILAGLGWYQITYWAWKRLHLKRARVQKILVYGAICVLAIGFQVFFTAKTFPYYLTYYNPMLGGIKKASQEIMIGWGEGLEQAAYYLNTKPDAEKLKVISWYRTGCFSYYFKGESRYIFIVPDIGEEKLQEYIETIDYAVIYQHQWNRQLPKDLLDYLAQQKPEHAVWIDGVEYVRIYKLKGAGS